jgi:hypothetical protein
VKTAFVILLLLAASTIGQAARLDEAALTKRDKEDARALRDKLMPAPERLGEQWKRPWEMPAVANWSGLDLANLAKKPTEDDFMDAAFMYDLRLPFGMSETEAAALYDTFVEMYTQTGGGQSDMTQRQFLNYYLAKRQDQDASAAEKVARMWTVAASGLALQVEKQTKKELGDVRHKVAIEMVGSRFAGLTDDQLKAAWVRQMTLVRRYSFMGYVRCADWQSPPPISWAWLTSQHEAGDKAKGTGAAVSAATINLRLIDEERCDALSDLNPADAPALAGRLAAAVRACAQARIQWAQVALDQEIEFYTKQNINAQMGKFVTEKRQKIAEQTAALAKIAVSVTPKLFGDNSYVIRVTGVTPDPPHIQFGMYTGWIRKGLALAEVALSGTFPSEEMDRDMDRILSELDAKLASYDSCPAKRLDVAQMAPAIAAPPPLQPTPAAPTPSQTQADAGTAPATPPPAPPAPASTPPATPPPPLTTQPPPTLEATRQRLWKNDLKGALADSIVLAAATPNDLQARALRAGLELVAGDPRTGLTEADALVKASPNDVWMWVLHGQALIRNNDFAAAKQSLGRAWQLDRNLALNIYNQANQILSAGVPSMAHLHYTTALVADPNLTGAYYGLGFACAQLGWKDQAIQAFEHYLRSDPSSAYAQKVRDELGRLKRSR